MSDDDSVDELRATLARLQDVWERLQAEHKTSAELDVSSQLKGHLRRLFSGDMLWSDSATAGAANGPVGVTFEGAWALDNAAGSAPNKLRSVVGDGDSITSAFVVAELEEVPQASGPLACVHCNAVVESDAVVADGNTFHADCFASKCVCRTCSKPLRGLLSKTQMYCTEHVPDAASVCAGCGEALTRQVVAALDRKWHSACFVCAECRKPFEGGLFFKVGGKPYCSEHALDDSTEAGEDEETEDTD